MPIYSKNRPTHSVTEAKSYGANDAGIILYESCVNDSILFNAMINHDRNEINAIKEGTILTSEIEALNEEAKSSIFESIAKRLEDLWEKIKAFFADAKRKVSAYLLGDCKAFAEEYEKVVGGGNAYDFTITVRVPNFKFESPKINFDENYRNSLSSGAEIDRSKIIAKDLAASLGVDGEYTPKQFREYIDKNTILVEKVSTTDDITRKMLKYLKSGGKDAIIDIKKAEDDAYTKIKEEKKKLKSSESNDDKVFNLALLTTKEQVISIVSKESVSLVRARISCCRKSLGAFLAAAKKRKAEDDKIDKKALNDSAIQDSIYDAIVEATIEIDNAFDSDVKITPEIESYINDDVA